MLNVRSSIIIIVLFAILAFLQYRLWFETSGIRDVMHMKAELAKQQIETDKLKKSNELLMAQIKQLQTSEDSTETHARHELGMIKKGETFYEVVK